MKYLITNKQLSNIMTNYLNDFKDSHDVSSFDTFIVIFDSPDNNDFTDVIIEYDSHDDRLFIDGYFLDTFVSWFPIDEEDSQEFIKDWFEKTFNVNVKYTQS